MLRQIEVKDGKVREPGVDHGGDGKVLAETPTHIVVKWPGSYYFAGIGMRAWGSPRIVVYEKLLNKKLKWEDGKVDRLIEWEVTRGK